MTFQNRFHYLRKNRSLKLQSNFCFVDTESYSEKISESTTVLKFQLACSIFWNRETNEYIEKTYFKPSLFWLDVEKRFNEQNKELILFAHNTEFDFKMLNGFVELYKLNWILDKFYIRNKIFIMTFTKGKYTLRLWSTTNYVAEPLKALGKSLGVEKLEVNFDTVPLKELEIYCKRDTEIIYLFIKRLLNFLEKFDLSKLKATAGSLAFNTFKHKFYYKIGIHNWIQTIKLERESYHGGISECFNFTELSETYKLDINSMYPSIMKKYRFPTKLIRWYHETNHSNQELMDIYNKIKNNDNYCCIAKITANIPKNNAYILNDYGLGKVSFCYGNNIKLTICEPELKFIEKTGTIVKIHQLAIYKADYIFNDYVDFFYNLRKEYKQNNDIVNVKFTKLLLNTLYGKFGQKAFDYKIIDSNSEFVKKNFDLIKCMIERAKEKGAIEGICYLGTLNGKYELYVVNQKLYCLEQTDNNSQDSFVAISSFITSYSRMLLIEYLKKANRKNVWYCDTDSLFVNKAGYNNLLTDIDTYELGKLKVEGIGKCKVFAPKFYDFNDTRKVKGVRKTNSELIYENNIKAVYKIEQWSRFKSDLKKGNFNQQIIEIGTKEVLKEYDKGNIINDLVYPFSIEQIQEISKTIPVT